MNGVMRFKVGRKGAEYVLSSDYDQLHAANQRLENDYKESVADGMEAARQIHRLESEVKRLREALEHIKAMQLRGFLVLGDKANELMQAALSTANGEVTE